MFKLEFDYTSAELQGFSKVTWYCCFELDIVDNAQKNIICEGEEKIVAEKLPFFLSKIIIDIQTKDIAYSLPSK